MRQISVMTDMGPYFAFGCSGPLVHENWIPISKLVGFSNNSSTSSNTASAATDLKRGSSVCTVQWPCYLHLLQNFPLLGLATITTIVEAHHDFNT